MSSVHSKVRVLAPAQLLRPASQPRAIPSTQQNQVDLPDQGQILTCFFDRTRNMPQVHSFAPFTKPLWQVKCFGFYEEMTFTSLVLVYRQQTKTSQNWQFLFSASSLWVKALNVFWSEFIRHEVTSVRPKMWSIIPVQSR